MKTLLILISLFLSITCRKLLLVQVTFRHGARLPVFINPFDNSALIQNVGELTKQGKNMHYLLGQQLSKRYWKQLFGGTPDEYQYNPSKIFVKSTDINRTIQSAQAHLMGWLQNLPPQKIKKTEYQFAVPPGLTVNEPFADSEKLLFGQKGSSFHTIPIHVQKASNINIQQGDFLTMDALEACQNSNMWITSNLNNENAKRFFQNQDVKKTLSALSQEYKSPISIQQAFGLYDNYDCFKHMGSSFNPIFQDQRYSQTLKFIKQQIFVIQLYDTYIQTRIAGTGYFKTTLQNFRIMINNRNSANLIFYSGHDNTIETILAATNLTSSSCIYNHYVNKIDNENECVSVFPGFASHVIFELYEQMESKYSLRMIYNGKVMILPFCNQQFCPFQKIENWIKDFIVKDMSKQCGNRINKISVPQTEPQNSFQKSQVEQQITSNNPNANDPISNPQKTNNRNVSQYSQITYQLIILALALIVLILLTYILTRKRQQHKVVKRKYKGYHDVIVQQHLHT